MNEKCIKLNASIYAKKGNLYAVIIYYLDGERQIKWRKLGLKENATRQEAKEKLQQAIQNFKTNELIPMIKGELKPKDKPPREEPKAWTVPQTAEYLVVSEKTIYKMLRKGMLGGVKAGGAWMIPNQMVYEFEDERKRISERMVYNEKQI